MDLTDISYVGVLWYITLGPVFQTEIDAHIEQPKFKNKNKKKLHDDFEVSDWESICSFVKDMKIKQTKWKFFP